MIIKATCEDCGDVELVPESILLELSQDGLMGTFAFLCPFCHSARERVIDSTLVRELLAAGACWDTMAADSGRDQPIDEDEIQAFVSALDRDDWFDQLRT